MKWEYKTLSLNRAGREGWELVAALDTNAGAGASYQIVAIFKRPRDAK